MSERQELHGNAGMPVSQRRLVWLTAAVVAIAYSTLSVLRHHNYWTGAFDIGIFDQSAWLLSKGHAAVSITGRHVLADHVSPVLLVFGAIYRVVASPYVFLIVQSVALATTVFPMVRIAGHYNVSPRLAVALTALNAPLLSAAVFDFHASVLAVPAIAWLVHSVVTDNRKGIAVFGGLVLFCRADLATFALGLCFVAHPPARKWLLGVAGAGISMSGVPALFGAAGSWSVDFAYLGSSPLDGLLHPWRIAIHLLSLNTVSILLIWLLPSAFMVLLRPRWLLAILVAGAPVLMVDAPGPSNPFTQYAATIMPLATAGALSVVATGVKRLPVDSVTRLIVGTTVASLLLLSPLSPLGGDYVRIGNFVTRNPNADFDRIIAAIPSDAVVSADDPVLSHLSHRKHLYAFPTPFEDVGPIAVAPDEVVQRSVRYIIAEDVNLDRAHGFGFTREVLRSGHFLVLERS